MTVSTIILIGSHVQFRNFSSKSKSAKVYCSELKMAAVAEFGGRGVAVNLVENYPLRQVHAASFVVKRLPQ
jgi:hypothetical protein